MSKARWSQLSKSEQLRVGNGCGNILTARFIEKHITNFFATASCRHHDFGYFVGGTLKDKISADYKFLKAMLSDTRYATSKLNKVLQTSVALGFYSLVSVFGLWPAQLGGFWHYRKKKLQSKHINLIKKHFKL